MKFMRAGAFAGSLMLLPHLGVAEDEVTWRAVDPVWQASSAYDWPANRIDNVQYAPRALAQGELLPARPKEVGPRIVQWSEAPLPAAPRSVPWDVDWYSNWSKNVLPAQAQSPKTESLSVPPREAGNSGDKSRPTPSTSKNSAQRSGDKTAPALPSPVNDPELPLLPLNKLPLPEITAPGILPLEDDEPVRPKILPPDVLPVAPAMILPPVKGVEAQAALGAPVPSHQRILPRVFGKSPSEKPADPAPKADGDNGFLNAVDPSGPRLSVSADYLLWWTKSDRVPVLASTGTPASVGILGRPGTRSLFGPGDVDLGLQSGARFRASLLLDEHSPYGVDAGFLFLANNGASFAANSNQYPVLSRPVFVLNNRQENAETVAYPNFSAGTLRIDTESQLWAQDANVFRRLCDSCDRTVDLFVGYRYMNLSDSVTITESIIAEAGAPDPIGTHSSVLDSFAARNSFNGGQIGAAVEQRLGNWFVNLRASVALGVNDQSIDVMGYQVQVRPGQAPTLFTGGLLAARSNIGSYSSDHFSVIPDVALNLGYQFTPNLRAYVGYNFLYWTDVVRAGEQIDRNVDLTFIPNSPPVTPTGQRRPAVPFQETDFWAQGINFGVEWRW